MKTLIIIALALVLGGGFIWLADFEPGFVLVKYGSWSLETSLIVFAFIFVMLLAAGYIALRSTVLIKRAPGKLSKWNQAQRRQRASKALTQGLVDLEEGRWAEAEQLLVRHAPYSESPLLHYLTAARAAQNQEETERRDNYLNLANSSTEGAEVTVGLVQAKLQLEHDQKEQALATLQALNQLKPKHPHVLDLLQKLYLKMNQWQDVQAVLPDLRKRNVLNSSDAKALSVDAAIGQMEAALARSDWEVIQSVWQHASAKERRNENMLYIYILALKQQNEHEQARALIEHFLEKGWSDRLAYQYGWLAEKDSIDQLAQAETWLKKQAENPWLLLTLGRLAMANELWAKAEAYLRQSIALGPRGETYQVLAEVLAVEGEQDAVSEAYQQGLELVLTKNEMLI